MKIGTGVFLKREETKIVCDCCKKDLPKENYLYYSTAWYEYGDDFGDSYDFCSLECMIKSLSNSDYRGDNTGYVRLEILGSDIKKLLDLYIKYGDTK